jgi:hypothetical protein
VMTSWRWRLAIAAAFSRRRMDLRSMAESVMMGSAVAREA